MNTLRGSKKNVEQNKTAFDLWLDCGLHDLFDQDLAEPISKELLEILEKGCEGKSCYSQSVQKSQTFSHDPPTSLCVEEEFSFSRRQPSSSQSTFCLIDSQKKHKKFECFL